MARAASPCSFLTPLDAAVKEHVDRQHSERERDEHEHKHGEDSRGRRPVMNVDRTRRLYHRWRRPHSISRLSKVRPVPETMDEYSFAPSRSGTTSACDHRESDSH